jgi:hypothetical protein
MAMLTVNLCDPQDVETALAVLQGCVGKLRKDIPSNGISGQDSSRVYHGDLKDFSDGDLKVFSDDAHQSM